MHNHIQNPTVIHFHHGFVSIFKLCNISDIEEKNYLRKCLVATGEKMPYRLSHHVVDLP